MASVLVVDDNLLTRLGLRYVVEHEHRGILVGEAKDCEGALVQMLRRDYNLVILDLGLGQKHCVHFFSELRRRHSSARVLAVTTRGDARHAAWAQQVGASGYIGKDAPRPELVRAIRNILHNRRHFEKPDAYQRARQVSSKSTSLSAREQRVMLALASGMRATEIAAELKISIKTVSTYKRRVLNKLQLNSLAELVRHVSDHKLFVSSSASM